MSLSGFQARLAAKVGVHNFCIWFNLHLGRAPLATARVARLVMPDPISHQTFKLVRMGGKMSAPVKVTRWPLILLFWSVSHLQAYSARRQSCAGSSPVQP